MFPDSLVYNKIKMALIYSTGRCDELTCVFDSISAINIVQIFVKTKDISPEFEQKLLAKRKLEGAIQDEHLKKYFTPVICIKKLDA